ncbi:MAG: Ada metal-binding domain-containing protein [Syntrophales bacterium]|nr:Ada metal-binding domain-containing protein [Syntrophales bacterium]
MHYEKTDNANVSFVAPCFVWGRFSVSGSCQDSPFSPNKSKNILLLQCENEARKNKLGIWALPLRNPSKEYLASKAGKEGIIKKFHLLECPHARRIDARNKVIFSSIDEALDDGYRPCRICNPLERHNH